MEIYYEGVDIYPYISLNKCIYDSYGEQKADSLTILFNDTDDKWDSWSPKKGDTIEAKLGTLRTGQMYVTSITQENGLMYIRASSVPGTYNRKTNKSWEAVTFKQLCREIAGRHGLTCEFYNVDDHTYLYVNQQNREDFLFLEERCILEGCAFLVYDRKMVVYGEYAIEHTATDNYLTVGNDVKFEFTEHSDNVYGKCRIKNSSFKGVYTSGENDKELTKVLNFKISSQAEADRFAKNILRFENKKMRTGICYSGQYFPGYAAGTVVNIETKCTHGWDGPVFMTHVRHDMVKATTKMWFRKPLEGY